MAASYFSGEVKETQRHKFGKLLGTRTRNLLLMTATPHNGKDADFQLFMGLLDDCFEGRPREGVHKADVSDMIRRLTKEELYRFDGTPLFPERLAYTASYALSPREAALYQAVTTYVREEMNRADRSGDGKRQSNVGFALQILQRRLASSPAAIHRSLERRRKRLEERLREEQVLKPTGSPKLTRQSDLPNYDPDEFDEVPGDEAEATEEQVLDEAAFSTRARATGSSLRPSSVGWIEGVRRTVKSPCGMIRAAPFSTGGNAVICRSRLSSSCRLCRRSTRRCAVASAFLGVDPLLPARTLFLAQPCGAHIPIIDFPIEAISDGVLDFVDLRETAFLYFGEMLGARASRLRNRAPAPRRTG